MAAKISTNNQCFVIMPITSAEPYPARHFHAVYEDLLEPAIKSAGLNPTRADKVSETNLIHLDILTRLLEARIVVCDISGLNPNVMFELGLRQAFDQPVVIIKDDATKSPFDIQGLRHIEYHSSLKYRDVLAAQSRITEALKATLAAKSGDSVNSIVKLLGLKQAAVVAPSDSKDAAIQVLMQEVQFIKSEVQKLSNKSISASGFRLSSSTPHLDKVLLALNQRTVGDTIKGSEIKGIVAQQLLKDAVASQPTDDDDKE